MVRVGVETVCEEVVRCANCGAKVGLDYICRPICPAMSLTVKCGRRIRDGFRHSHGNGEPSSGGNAIGALTGGVVEGHDWPVHHLRERSGGRGACLRCNRVVAPPKGGDFSHAIYTTEAGLATCLE